MAIISLTSIPARFSGLPETLASLLRQTVEVDEIRLHIPQAYRRFPDWDGTLPDVPKGVRVIRTEDDLGPASKALHAVRDLKGTSTPILFCDDDRIYPQGWAKGLLKAHAEKPDCCIAVYGRHLHKILKTEPLPLPGPRAKVGKEYFDPAYRWERTLQRLRERRATPLGPRPSRRPVAQPGYSEVLLGYAGVLVLPEFFDETAFDIPHDVWMVDDIWLSGQLARRNVPIWLPKRQPVCLRATNDPVAALRDSVFDGADRDCSNRRAIAYFQQTYGIWQATPS
ncbi:glycosyltransferase family 2 protein [Sagittula sp. NFXS13]|uniref:glycosyltransferase n=1 Tax=Sagittula sp. NFXS13 TaxID=2819095 RepID=UPI0032DF86DF